MDADQLLGFARHPVERHVDLGLPVAEAWAGERAERAPLVTVGTTVGSFLQQLDRQVVLVSQDVEGAGDDARGAAGAQTGGDDLVVELSPLSVARLGRHLELSLAPAGLPLGRLS